MAPIEIFKPNVGPTINFPLENAFVRREMWRSFFWGSSRTSIGNFSTWIVFPAGSAPLQTSSKLDLESSGLKT